MSNPSRLRSTSLPSLVRRTFTGRCRFLCRNYSVKAKSYYDVLEITPKASPHQVKAAYYRLSKKYHPDINDSTGARSAFSAISEAYDVLGNKQRRRLYDQGLFNPETIHGSGATGGPVDTTYEEFLRRTGHFGPKKEAPTGKTKYYDFDEFYRQHYGTSVHASRQHKEDKAMYEKDFEETKVANKRNYAMYVALLLLVLWRASKR